MIIKPTKYREKIKEIMKVGLESRGLQTGFSALDYDLKFRIALGRFMVISGIPGMGKSEFLDALMLNMALLHGWRTLYFSPENNPEDEHVTALVEKIAGKKVTLCSAKECDSAIETLDQYFTWIRPKDKTIDHILEMAKQEKDKNGLECLIIDPWNYVTQNRGGVMLHEHLSESLNKITTFTREENILVIVVAHPTNLKKEKDGSVEIPTLYTISDGAQWRNKMDIGMIIHRPNQMMHRIEVYIGKRKKKWMGNIGMVELDYDVASGRFKSLDEKEFLLPSDIRPPF